jgi:hypothetical protein
MSKAHSKSTAPHTTAIEAARCFISLIEKDSSVTKVSLGIIKFIKGARGGVPKRIKCTHESACLVVKVRGNLYTQVLRFYTKSTQELQKKIETFAKKEGFHIT